MTPDFTMPENFEDDILKALQKRKAAYVDSPLIHLRLAHKIRRETGTTNKRAIINKILEIGLDMLKQINPDGFKHLQARFFQDNPLKMGEIAQEVNTSVYALQAQQRTYVAELAKLIWEEEKRLRQAYYLKFVNQLEQYTPPKLFGIDDVIQTLCTLLEKPESPWLITLAGMGGSGKTALADKIARYFAGETHFYEIGWVSARQQLFRFPGNIEQIPDPPQLTLSAFVDHLIEQFEDLHNSVHLSFSEKLENLTRFLKNNPCLIIVDNLETAADVGDLVWQLMPLLNPTKIVLTTRYTLHHLSQVYNISVEQLSLADTCKLIDYEAEERNLNDLQAATSADKEQIYTISGGNPLAIKLIIGQVCSLSLPRALQMMQAVSGQSAEALFTYLYREAWAQLDPQAQAILQAMVLVPDEGGQLAQIATVVNLDEGQVATHLQQLATLSLIAIKGGLQTKRYGLHALTRIFVARQMKDDQPLTTVNKVGHHLKRDMILRNGYYWLNYLEPLAKNQALPHAESQGMTHALDYLLLVDDEETWALAQKLALALHPHLEKRGYWSEWLYFLTLLKQRAVQRTDRAAEAEWLSRQGDIQRQQEAYKAAILAYRRAWYLFCQLDNLLGRGRALSNLGNLYRLTERFKRAEALCYKALAIFKTLGDGTRRAYTENHLGLIYLDQAEWEAAKTHLTNAQLLWQQLNNPQGLAKTLHNLGELHHRTKAYETARTYFREAIDLYDQVGDEVHATRTHINLGNTYLRLEEWEEAHTIYSHTEKVLKRIGDISHLARVRHNLGMVYTQLSYWAEAEAYFNQSLTYWRTHHDSWHIANTLSEQTVLYTRQKKMAEAQTTWNEAWGIVANQTSPRYATLREEVLSRKPV